jgi:sugar phosphate permease
MNRWTRIIPAAFIMYTIAYIDRTNFSLAIPALQHEFGLSASQAGLASGVFFISYVLSQMPGGHLAQVWSAKWLIFWSMIVWGAASTLCGLSHSLNELLVYRFLLGLGEGGVWPAAVVLLANWFEPKERARANGYWVLCQPAAIILSSPLSGWLLDRYDWRMMFIVQGLFPIVFAAIWWWAVEDYPEQARWLKEEDTVKLNPVKKTSTSSAKGLLLNRNVFLFLVLNLAFACGAYGLLIWLPSAIRSLGVKNNLLIGLLTAAPYVSAGLGAIWTSRSSDRMRERRWHVAVPSVVGGVALWFGFSLGSRSPVLAMLLLCVTGASIYACLGPKWAMMTEIFSNRSAGMTLGLLNGFGNIGGFAGPYAVGVLRDRTHSFASGFIFLAASLAVSGILILFVRDRGREHDDAGANKLSVQTSR